jgi:hypothetical protein
VRYATELTSADKLLAVVLVLFACHLASLTPANAQSQGQNAVYNGSGNTVGSYAFIDASMFAGNPPQHNICAVLNYVLAKVDQPPAYPMGAVIDARGLPGSTGTSMTCTASPWAGITSPSTILLPAATITIPGTWALPSNTKLIGEGYGTTGGTVIQACTTSTCSSGNFPIGNPMIQFGPFSCPNGPCYTGISVENLMLNGAGQNINGIQNSRAQSSYVDHVTFFQILGTGLQIGAPNSGPYTNITFDSGSSALSSTTCVNLNGATSTQGIRGITCIAGTNATTAIYLDASNNSLKDVRIAGFYDGILVGSQASAQSNALFNIFGLPRLFSFSPNPNQRQNQPPVDPNINSYPSPTIFSDSYSLTQTAANLTLKVQNFVILKKRSRSLAPVTGLRYSCGSACTHGCRTRRD